MYATCDCPTPELVTAPTAEPVSLAELKHHCKVDLDDDDGLLRALGAAAREWMETALDRQLVTATWKVRYDRFPGSYWELPYPPLVSATIAYKDTALVAQTLSSSVYNVVTWQTPGAIELKNGQAWPATGIAPDAVTVTFVAGYGVPSAVSDLVKAGIKLLAGHWYANREAVTDGQAMSLPLGVDHIVAATRAYRF